MNFIKHDRKIVMRRKGFSLIDSLIGLLILFIIALGVLTYRYTAALNLLKAKQQLTAADLAATFIETWQGVSGENTFDPETAFVTDMTITTGTGQDAPGSYTLLGKYDVLDDNTNYQLTLSWKDAGSSLRELNVIVTWSFVNETNPKTYQLTTYVDRS